MNSHYLIYDRATGGIMQSVFCQTTLLDAYTQNGDYGSLEVDQQYTPDKYKVSGGKVIELDVQPSVSVGEQRMYAYPSVGEQLDAIWHAMDQGLLPKIEPMYSQVKAVKDSIPKVK